VACTSPQARGGGVDVALDDEDQLARRALEQQVAHGPADEVHAVVRREGAQQPRAARVGAQRVESGRGLRIAQSNARYPRACSRACAAGGAGWRSGAWSAWWPPGRRSRSC
jgi:hypothetical protein